MTDQARAQELARRFINASVDYTHAEIICAALGIAGVLIRENPEPPPPEITALLKLMQLVTNQLLTIRATNETRH